MLRRLPAWGSTACEAEPVFAYLCELPLLLRRFGPGELEEMRRRDQTAVDRKSAVLGTEIDDRRSFRARRGEAPPQRSPPQLRKLIRAVFEPTNHRDFIGRLDVLARLQVRRGLRPSHGDACLAEGREIIAIRNMVAEIVAHSRMQLGHELIMLPPSPRLLRIRIGKKRERCSRHFPRRRGCLVKLKTNDRAFDMIASGQGVREADSEAA